MIKRNKIEASKGKEKVSVKYQCFLDTYTAYGPLQKYSKPNAMLRLPSYPIALRLLSSSFMIYCFKALILVFITVDILRARWKMKITRKYISKLYRMF